MISYIKGTVDYVDENSVIVECNGIGYAIQVPTSVLGKIATGQAIKIYTYMQVKQDGISLIGFLGKEELHMFHMLTTVTGVGSKAGLSMLSSLSPTEIVLAVLTDDTAALGKAPGVGKKIAQRIALELKDKFKKADSFVDASLNSQQSFSATSGATGAKQDAIDALSALGYGRSEAVKAVMEVAVEEMTAEQIIRLALKKLSAF